MVNRSFGMHAKNMIKGIRLICMMKKKRVVSGLPIGLLINFRRRKLDYQRLHQSEVFKSEEEGVEEPIPF